MLADKLNMEPEAAEKWIVNLIRSARLSAKLDSQVKPAPVRHIPSFVLGREIPLGPKAELGCSADSCRHGCALSSVLRCRLVGDVTEGWICQAQCLFHQISRFMHTWACGPVSLY